MEGSASVSKKSKPAVDEEQSELPIPPRWLQCPRWGAVVEDTFIPFKTPLDAKYDSQVPLQNRFTVEMLLGSEAGAKMGLVIDLTRTDRYYSKETFEKAGVRHYKLECRGHDEAPTVEQTMAFVRICQAFRTNNPDRYIGVHCTHGFNRTGFLISAYLVESEDMAIEMALGTFSQARPTGIYKEDYIVAACERYDGVAEDFLPVVQPDWADDSADLVAATRDLLEKLMSFPQDKPIQGDELAEVMVLINYVLELSEEQAFVAVLGRHGWIQHGFEGNVINDPADFVEDLRTSLPAPEVTQSANGSKRKRGHNATDANCEEEEAKRSGLNFAFKHPGCLALDEPYLGPMRKTCRELVGAPEGTSFPGQQPVSLTRKNLEMLRNHEYLVSWKADGTRYLIMALGKRGVFAVGRDNSIFNIKPMLFTRRGDPTKLLDNTIIDGELVKDEWQEGGKKHTRWRYLAYDLVCLSGKAFHKYSYLQRLDSLYREVIGPRDRLKADPKFAAKYNFDKEPFSIRRKAFVSLLNLESEKFSKIRSMLQHEEDGLIFAKVHEPYKHGQCNTLLKFKDSKDNSIDFLVKVSTEPGTGTTVGDLLVSHRGALVRFPLTKSQWRASAPQGRAQLKTYHNKIVECIWDAGRETWTPRNVRADKTHPNSMHTAESVLESIHSNLTESVLQILVVDKVKKLRQRTRQLLREAVRRGSVVAMDPDDRQTLNQVTMQLYQADPAIKQVCKAAGFDGMAFSDKTSGPDCQTLVDAITTIWRTS